MKYKLSLLLALCSLNSLVAADSFKVIKTDQAPGVLGSYAQGLSVDLQKVQNLIFVSGQVAIDPKTGKMIDNDIKAATKQTMDNIEAILKAAGSDWSHVVRVDCFLQRFDRDWDGMNEVYTTRFPDRKFPARQTVGVVMDSDTLIEMSCIAVIPKK